MAVDKNLFLYDLAVVAIMKNEEPYVKEWLDYHLLAGVEHFYIYDNDSTPEFKNILQPYIDAEIVTYIPYPGGARQNEAYNDAVKNYRFFCRYMAFIDGDEFIFPQSDKSIIEVVDELLADKTNATALAVNRLEFGSNYQDNADFSRGVLERFTRRASDASTNVKSIINPRRVDYFYNPHFAMYFFGYKSFNEVGGEVATYLNEPPTIDKIRIYHYPIKSAEEWLAKVNRGTADNYNNIYKPEDFSHSETANEIFDDSILKYLEERKKFLKIKSDKEILSLAKKVDYNRCFSTLKQELEPLLVKELTDEDLVGKMETFLTCRAVASELNATFFVGTTEKTFEEGVLTIISLPKFLGTLEAGDIGLLLSELPHILQLKYPAMKTICQFCRLVIPVYITIFQIYNQAAWREFVDLKQLIDYLQIIEDKM